jgi:hypothetical protein
MSLNNTVKNNIFQDLCENRSDKEQYSKICFKYGVSRPTVYKVARENGVEKKFNRKRIVNENMKVISKIFDDVSIIVKSNGILIARDNSGNFVSLKKISENM